MQFLFVTSEIVRDVGKHPFRLCSEAPCVPALVASAWFELPSHWLQRYTGNDEAMFCELLVDSYQLLILPAMNM